MGWHHFSFRVWVLLSGLRHRDMKKLSMAIARANPHTEKALVEFVAQKLGHRRDPYSREVLNDWLNGSCPVRKSAATSAMNVSPWVEHVVSNGSCESEEMSRESIHSSG